MCACGCCCRRRRSRRQGDQDRRCRRLELAAKPHVLVGLVRRHAERRVHVRRFVVSIRRDRVEKEPGLAGRVRGAGSRQHADERGDARTVRTTRPRRKLRRREQRRRPTRRAFSSSRGTSGSRASAASPASPIKAGRMEFIDGSEVTPAHGTLAALKRDRIAQRLLANFGWTDVQRSLDGAQYVLNMPKLNITAVAARPTEGVFQVSGWDELKINVFYGALTGQHGKYAATDWRVFALGYSDYRSGVVKTDNRAAAVRNADADSIDIGTYGGHILQIVPTATGPGRPAVLGRATERIVGHADTPRRRVCRRSRMAAGSAEDDQAVDSRRLRLRIGRRQRGRRHALDVLPGAADAPHLRADAVLQHDEQQGRLRRADPPAEARHGPLRHSRRCGSPTRPTSGTRVAARSRQRPSATPAGRRMASPRSARSTTSAPTSRSRRTSASAATSATRPADS